MTHPEEIPLGGSRGRILLAEDDAELRLLIGATRRQQGMQDHGGFIEVDTEVGKGTAVSLYLPT